MKVPTRPGIRTTVLALMLTLQSGCISLKRFAYEGFGRDRWQHPDEVIESLDVKPGSTVADLGAGAGYFTFRLARAVGQSGRVYAIDLDPALANYAVKRAAAEGFENVTAVIASFDNPNLAASSVDLFFTCNTYHHLRDRSAYFAGIRPDLRPGAHVAIIDFKRNTWFARVFGHSTPAEVIRSEMQAAGYRLVSEPAFLPDQNFLVFAPGVN